MLVLLSGGLDSTVLTAQMHALGKFVEAGLPQAEGAVLHQGVGPSIR
jgi:asparagine synthetase B (glutamine-hydrolysing)